MREEYYTQKVLIDRLTTRCQQLTAAHANCDSAMKEEMRIGAGLIKKLESEMTKYRELSRELEVEQAKVANRDSELAFAREEARQWQERAEASMSNIIPVTITVNPNLKFPWGEGKWWPDRNARIAARIPEKASVIDIGGGLSHLAESVTGRYVSLDREQWTNLTVAADFNKGEFPDVGVFDIVVCQGALEYMDDPCAFLQSIRKYGPTLYLTYQLGKSGEPFKRNELSFEELFASLMATGWEVFEIGRAHV